MLSKELRRKRSGDGCGAFVTQFTTLAPASETGNNKFVI